VSAREENGRLLLEVADTGRGAAGEARSSGTGVGLANVRERLAAAFSGARFEAGPNPAGGFTVRLSIPR
jgi:signal transduction histidine kinase